MTSQCSIDLAPRLSIIMSVYNGEPYLPEAIESVLSQTFEDFEFLIHDDGSTDRSRAILRDYAQADGRIIVTHSENKGLAAALNDLIKSARADILARMDADDICLPDRFERQMTYLQQTPDCILLGAHDTIIDGDGRPITSLAIPTEHADIDHKNLHGVTAIHHPTVCIRREAVRKCGGYDPGMLAAQDLDLWLRMAEIGQIANLPDVVLKYRVHDASISGSKRDLQRQMCLQACQAAWKRRGLTDMSFDYSDWRMAGTAASRREFYLRYGWQAWKSGYRDTWRYYALVSIKLGPFSAEAWKLLVFGWLRRPSDRTIPENG